MPFANNFRSLVLKKESGVVESTLVVIPLLVLFLVTLHIIASVNFRNLDLTLAQSAASTAAISTVVSSEDEVVTLGSSSNLNQLRLIITHHHRTLPQIAPNALLSESSVPYSLDLAGIAVMERR